MKKQLHILSLDDAFFSIDDLWLYNLNQYFKTNDANWFIEGFTGREVKLDAKDLEAVARKLTEQYYEATGDRSMELRINLVAKINSLATKYSICKSLVDIMWKGFGDSEAELTMRMMFVKELEAWGYKINPLNTEIDDKVRLIEILETLEGIETEIHVLNEKLKKKQTSDAIDFNEMLLIAEKGLGLGRKINPKDTTVSEWVGYMNQLSKISKQN